MNSPFRRSALGLALGAAAALALAGCTAPADTTGSSGALRVVATTTQLADFAAQIGGDDIELTGLLTAGASAHHFDPSPADLLALGRADVLVINGAGLETFIDSAIEASGFDGAIIDASEGVPLDLAREITAEAGDAGDHDHDADDHADDHTGHDHDTADDHAEDDHDDHADEVHANEDHDDHDHGELNPHLWTSPTFAAGMVNEIATGFAAADAANAEAYTARAAEYTADLETLDAWAADQFAAIPAAERVLVTGHDSLRYYLHDYGIEFAGALLPSFEDNAEPSAAEVDALVAAIKERGVRAIFVESSLSPKLAKAVAAEAGITVVDEASLYVDSLGPADSGAATYLAATVHNTTVILEAWGVTPEPVGSAL